MIRELLLFHALLVRVNFLMIFNKLALVNPKPKNMRLLMANHLIKRLVGVVYDFLVNVDKFVFPIDFVVLDFGHAGYSW